MKTQIVGLVIVLAAMLSFPAKASPLVFDFSIVNDYAGGSPITGQLVFDTTQVTTPSGTYVTPLSIIITSNPNDPAVAAASDHYVLETNGFSYISPASSYDTFDITDSSILGTDANGVSLEKAAGTIRGVTKYIYYDFNLAPTQFNGEFDAYTGSSYGNTDGFGATPNGSSTGGEATYSAVPEPSQWGSGVFIALAGVVALRRFSSRAPVTA